MGIFLIILGWAFIVLGAVLAIYKVRLFNKSGVHELNKPLVQGIGLALGIVAIGGIVSNIGYALSGQWPIDAGHYVMLLIGAPIFYASVLAFGVTFYFRYWRTDLAEKCKKNNGLVMIASIPLMILSFLLAGRAWPLIWSIPW